jgi:Tol biopolymer transport system component
MHVGNHRGKSYEWERIKLRDPETGVYYIQLTNAPLHSNCLYFEHPNFTADNRSLLFYSQRMASRNSGHDLFRVDVDGSDLVQLSDEEHPFGSPIPSPDSARVIYGVRGNALLALNIDTFEERVIARCEEVLSLGPGTLTGDGTHYLSIGSAEDGTRMVVRFRTDGSEMVTFGHGYPRAHLTSNYSGTILAFFGTGVEYTCDIDGKELRRIPGPQQFSHCTWHGKEDVRIGTYLPPGHGIATAGVNDTEKKMICSGPYFCHSASSAAGEWVVSDTNWPMEGIFLIHVPSGRYAKLVNPPLRFGHPGITHPHPSFNRDGTKVVFTSNETGLSQVYLIEIPEDLREEVVSGELNYRLRWRR